MVSKIIPFLCLTHIGVKRPLQKINFERGSDPDDLESIATLTHVTYVKLTHLTFSEFSRNFALWMNWCTHLPPGIRHIECEISLDDAYRNLFHLQELKTLEFSFEHKNRETSFSINFPAISLDLFKHCASLESVQLSGTIIQQFYDIVKVTVKMYRKEGKVEIVEGNVRRNAMWAEDENGKVIWTDHGCTLFHLDKYD